METKKIDKIYFQLENDIVKDIIRRIKKTGEITSTADWQIGRLHQMGYSSNDIENMIQSALKKSLPEMWELYDDVIEWEYVRNRDLYEMMNDEFIPYEDNEQIQQWVESAKKQTADTLKNITRTIGVAQTINGQITYLPLTDYMIKTLDDTLIEITSGAFDYATALKKTVKTLSRSGIRTIDYASGCSSKLPVAVRRAVMTGVTNLSNQVSDYNAMKLGTDYFEVSYHPNARPSHREWQGKVYTREELTTVCGLGSVTGLCGANCYHEYYPFVPGISERVYSDEELADLNEKEDIKRHFRGKEYNSYEATQRQRHLEVNMRALRLEIKGLQWGNGSHDDIMSAQIKYHSVMQEYKMFSNHMNLEKHLDRVYMDGLGKVSL